MFVPPKAFRIFLGNSCLILLKKQKVCAGEIHFHFLPKRDKIPIPLAADKYTYFLGRPNFLEFLELHKYSKESDCYRLFYFDRFYFLCVACLFWWLYGFLWWVFAIEKLEYSRYNTKTYELVWYITYSSGLLFLYSRISRRFYWVLCDWSFEVLGYLTMDEGRMEDPKLGDAPASLAIIQKWETN